MRKGKPGYVYFITDTPKFWAYVRLIFLMRIKVKIGYSGNVSQRDSNHQTGNSRRIWHLVKPIRFKSQSAAKRFERFAHRAAIFYAGEANGRKVGTRVKNIGNASEWFWIGLVNLLRIRFVYGKQKPVLILVIGKGISFVRKLLVYLANSLDALYYKWVSQYVRGMFDWLIVNSPK